MVFGAAAAWAVGGEGLRLTGGVLLVGAQAEREVVLASAALVAGLEGDAGLGVVEVSEGRGAGVIVAVLARRLQLPVILFPHLLLLLHHFLLHINKYINK